MKIKDIKTMDIQRFINDTYANGASTALLRKLKNIVHSSLKQAVTNQMINRNVCEGVILPKHNQKEVRALSREEEKNFLQAIEGDRLATAFKLDLVSGLRMGELLALSWKNIDLEGGIIKVRATLVRLKDRSPNAEKKNKYLVENTTKTASGRRQIPIPKAAVKMLEEHKNKQDEEMKISKGLYEDDGLVFCTALGNRLIPRNVERSFVRLAKKAGIEGVNIHSVRHTLDVYTHVMPDTKSEAVKALDYIFE